MPSVALLHTAEVHKKTFTHLFQAMAPEITLDQIVQEDWLAEARKNGVSSELSDKVQKLLTTASQDNDVVICTCSTLGPIADLVAQENKKVFRIDRPMMAEAVKSQGRLLIVVCLESTVEATKALVEEAFEAEGKTANFEILLCDQAWPFFENGDVSSFAEAITQDVCEKVETMLNPGPIVLAQASMLAAAPLLMEKDLPVLTSPIVAARTAINMVS
jgi:hypothetical protein